MRTLLLLCLSALFACHNSLPAERDTPALLPNAAPGAPSADAKPAAAHEGSPVAEPPGPGLEVATFAGGCFWCMEPPFEKQAGVQAVLSGYAGGKEEHPTYKQVSYGRTGHTESVRVIYDPKVVSYRELLAIYWRNIDPTDPDGQFVDQGPQYRPVVFYHSEAQKAEAQASKQELAASGRFSAPIAVTIEAAGAFWVAEEYHQDFYKKSPDHYYGYRSGSGRDAFIKKYWGSSEH